MLVVTFHGKQYHREDITIILTLHFLQNMTDRQTDRFIYLTKIYIIRSYN